MVVVFVVVAVIVVVIGVVFVVEVFFVVVRARVRTWVWARVSAHW